MRFILLSLALVLSLIVAACGFAPSEEETEVTETGVDVKNDPLGVLGALGGLAGDLQEYQKEIENMEPVEPVHFNDLIQALPAPPAGWNCEEPKGSTNQMGDFTASQAQLTCTEEGAKQRVSVTINDWAYYQAFYMPFILSARFSQESTDGYNKGIKLGDDPGREEWSKSRQRGERSFLRKKRYLIKIDVRNGDPATFDEWTKLVDVSHLPG